MNYFVFLAYYLLTTIIIALIIMGIYKFYFKRKVKKISLDQEKILEEFFKNY